MVDAIRSSQKLIVAGAGKDAIPVVEFAAKAGFSVTVLDSRAVNLIMNATFLLHIILLSCRKI